MEAKEIKTEIIEEIVYSRERMKLEIKTQDEIIIYDGKEAVENIKKIIEQTKENIKTIKL